MKSPESYQSSGETKKSIAEENREEYKNLFELKEKSEDPAIQKYFEEKIAEVINSANEQMDDIHDEANLDNTKIDSLKSYSEEQLNTFRKEGKNIREILEDIWEKADELGLKGKQKELAQILLYPKNTPGHRCYDNDRFYIAHKSGLKDKNAATEVISNGMCEYFESRTHGGHQLGKLLNDEGIITNEEYDKIKKEEEENTLYATLPQEAIKKIAEKYNIDEAELEGIALNLCLSALQEGWHKVQGGVYNLRSGSGNLYKKETIENLAKTYLKPDLANVIINRVAESSFFKKS